MKVKLSDITVDFSIYPRKLNEEGEPDWVTTVDYYYKMKMGVKFPPIILTKLRGKLLLVDGLHRLRAKQKLCKEASKKGKPIQEEAEAEVIRCKDYDEAYIQALQRNLTHGEILSSYEKTDAIARLQQRGYSLKEISTILTMPVSTLKRWDAERIVWKGDHKDTSSRSRS